jgi:subtilisin family serine protease
VLFCIVDSGVDAASQADLAAALISGCDPVSSGYPCAPWSEDVWGHGTHVAGTIGAVRDQHGIAGVAGSRARMHVYNLFGSASDVEESDLILALDACFEELERLKAAVSPAMKLVGGGWLAAACMLPAGLRAGHPVAARPEPMRING